MYECQTAIIALAVNNIKSSLVLKCRENINALSLENRVNLYWVLRHKGVEKNQESDILAKQGITPEFMVPKLATTLAKMG